ncbi:tRNA (adenosine(37)-N6)-threonylcarbamoyltransferase complex dimerization subunit type 1 TsaB [Kaistia geumhonensis]|uniref:tRNA threonylcarbamoyladenosine biosynthesis protein TsaB n=1 Tax=Kaistia geumhonensis TaxID=410839 RepID=A0ABU0M7Z1_9HYPH|nr:tRNA (adenosine(37)-N6)-threonylcarbamoyltransferase complex dimerization subunit type 1 TsaB [Kaistia geumhonensis]MCX5477858.1 tRNA (adenosine(37)-N6)-threonylcarbamoyltransferase complex dimerization subunit type 1 TsaB [Kaistia geumhonensis]MDQ0516930.1 tRNA threonylcarbamoyladenosine biosynthesis protein TsaB [Kaistia geumhonensis]
MILLAIDTALENASVGLVAGDRRWTRVATIGRGHAEILMDAIAGLLAEAAVPPAALERIAVTVGPGSFTGLRVGIAAARGLALVRRIPVVGVPTLMIHAVHALALMETPRPVLALLPARGDELYGQAFDADCTALCPPSARSAADFVAEAAAGGFAVAGAGATLLGEGVEPVHRDSAPSIDTLLDLGARLDPDLWPPKPLYVKPPDAAPQAGARIARR